MNFLYGVSTSSTATMPRTPGRAQVLQGIDTEVEGIAYAYALASPSEEGEEWRGSQGLP